ncbi:MAG TPA: hypothetical protein VMS31_10570, partial [Pyrinomonadaceae bacterium]|nr:hypothetical protein [Pyrinomonadaceae bacterium]
MDESTVMKSNTISILTPLAKREVGRNVCAPRNTTSILAGLVLGLVLLSSIASAQSPAANASPSPTKSPAAKVQSDKVEAGEDAGDYTVTSSIELGYRGQRVVGDVNKYRSDLNYKAGPRIFDSSLLMTAKDGKGKLFESLLVTSTGWGSDPYGHLRINAEKAKWYQFDANYRRLKYFRFVNNHVNPNWVFSPANFSVPPNPITGEHGFDTRTQMGDFDLTLLPKNRTIK